EQVDIYEQEQPDGRFLKHIKFRFPVYFGDRETQELCWDNESTVETVALLTRKKDVERIDIEMTVDREDVTEKATYQKIKEYVKEKYGLNVHTKYIAEVKRKHGLPMHEAPNKVDVPKKEYPRCPEVKVTAIEEALKYFGVMEQSENGRNKYI
ncbi:MAG: recombinase family protein, partial [Bariatricus massiliensis]|nr:recombinase family protein [Bariatricus massiliensis]